MVRIPSLSRRTEAAPTQDESLDGGDVPAVASRDDAAERRAAERAAVARAATARPHDEDRRVPLTTGPDTTPERTLDDRTSDLDRNPAGAPDGGTNGDRTAEGPLDGNRTTEGPLDGNRTAAGQIDGDRTTQRPADRDGDGVADREEQRPAPVGPKPRASMLATLGLIVGLAGALFVLTGTLAGYGIGVGAVGAVLAVLGLMATRRRHIAGKTDALLGIVFGVGAVVVGVLAMTGQFDWPTTDGDWVARLREWLDSQFVDRF